MIRSVYKRKPGTDRSPSQPCSRDQAVVDAGITKDNVDSDRVGVVRQWHRGNQYIPGKKWGISPKVTAFHDITFIPKMIL